MVISDYFIILLLVILWVVGMIIVYRVQGKDMVLNEIRVQAYQLMILAEKTLVDSDGESKMEWVCFHLSNLLPKRYKWILNENLKYVIQLFYDEVKDFLDDGQMNDSI